MSAREYLRIGEVAAHARVNVQTLRYYERIGLLPEPRRLSSGYRAYPPETVRTVRFVKRAQALGFSLAEIRSLLRLTDRPGGCAEIRELADQRIARLDAEIANLKANRDELRHLASACARSYDDAACPLTGAIENATG